MKSLAFISFLFLAQNVLAATRVECPLYKPKTELSVNVTSGDVVEVQGHEFISGHRWMSLDSLEAKMLEPAKVGSTNTIAFFIDTKNQNERSKTYMFQYKRPWETTALSECNVTVVRN